MNRQAFAESFTRVTREIFFHGGTFARLAEELLWRGNGGRDALGLRVVFKRHDQFCAGYSAVQIPSETAPVKKRRRLLSLNKRYFFSFTSTLAMVFSHSSLRTAESPPVLSKEMVNSSSPDERCVTFIGMRPRS
jgi:hypothetical protein